MYIRMNGKNINFDDKKNQENKRNTKTLSSLSSIWNTLLFFYKNKRVFQIDDNDVNKILVSKKEPYDTKNALKYFIGYNDNDVIRPLCSRLPQMTGYA